MLELPHQDDSNEYPQHVFMENYRKLFLNYHQIPSLSIPLLKLPLVPHSLCMQSAKTKTKLSSGTTGLPKPSLSTYATNTFLHGKIPKPSNRLMCFHSFWNEHDSSLWFDTSWLTHPGLWAQNCSTVIILCFRGDGPGQTVQTQIWSILIRVYTVCNFVCIFKKHYSMIKPRCSNFRVITANFLDVWIYRILTVLAGATMQASCVDVIVLCLPS